MEQVKEYLLRADVYPIAEIDGARNTGLLQVHNYRFSNLDDAFLHLYDIPVNCYDKKIALDMGERFFVDRVSITAPGLRHPLMEIVKPEAHKRKTETPGSEVIYLNKGESHELLSDGLRKLFNQADLPELQASRMPIASYQFDSNVLAPARGVTREIILEICKPEQRANETAPFSVHIRSNVYGSSVPPGVPSGTTVVDVFRYADLGEAVSTLFNRVDLNMLDPVIAFNSKLSQSISSAELIDKSAGQRLASLLTVHYDDMNEVLPKAGAYLRFDGNLRRALVEIAVPQLSHLQIEPGSHIATIGHYNEAKNHIDETAGFKQLKAALSTIYLPATKNIRHRERQDPGQGNHNGHPGPSH